MYNETTVLNGEEIKLSGSQKESVGNFHKSRVAFAVLKDNTLAINVKDEREHRVYLKEDFGLTDSEIDALVRGYIKPGKINFYKGSDFKAVQCINESAFERIKEACREHFGMVEYVIGDGLILGEVGTEWERLFTGISVRLRDGEGEREMNYVPSAIV